MAAARRVSRRGGAVARVGCALVALVIAGGGGCRTRLLDELDDGGAARPDATAPCFAHHSREVVALAYVAGLDGAVAQRGRAVRVRVGVPLRPGCDVAGSIAATLAPGPGGEDVVSLVAERWAPREPASCGATAVRERVVVVSDAVALRSGRVVVRDGAPGGTARFDFQVGAPLPETCAPLALGAPCQADCECRLPGVPAARCLGSPARRCAVSCSEDADCAGADTCDPATHLCGGGPRCASDAACNFGQRCTGGACRPAQTTTHDAPCACDAECGFGGLCKLGVDLPYCAVPCTTTADCPPTWRCIQSSCIP